MTRVDLVCQRIMLSLLIEQLQRGPLFTRLLPARYWHNHPNQLTPAMRVGSRGHQSYNGDARFAVSRRKWMLDPQIDSAAPPQPVPLRMPEKPYSYRDLTPLRKHTALQILKSLHEQGDVCGIGKSNYWVGPAGVACGRFCVCIVITTREFHRHRCIHGVWRHRSTTE